MKHQTEMGDLEVESFPACQAGAEVEEICHLDKAPLFRVLVPGPHGILVRGRGTKAGTDASML
ncbi:MAG: hypothetical protein R6V03_02365 [Kiritimatiellia bacterium]